MKRMRTSSGSSMLLPSWFWFWLALVSAAASINALACGFCLAIWPRRVPLGGGPFASSSACVSAVSGTSIRNGIWLDWRNGYEADLIAVVKMPRGFSRMNCCKTGICSSACAARRYILANQPFVVNLLTGVSSTTCRGWMSVYIFTYGRTERVVGQQHIGPF